MRRLLAALASLTVVAAEPAEVAQFRGANSTETAKTGKLPTKIGPDAPTLWKTALPPGHSSPVVHGDRLYLTGFRNKALLTIALDRHNGKVLWEAEAPYKQLEKLHSASSPAMCTPATDGRIIVSFFGSSGLTAFDRDGKQLWHLPLGPFKNELGSGSSPIIVGDVVILNQDHDSESFLLAVDKRTGKQLWKTDRNEFTCANATPVVWEVNGKKQIVVAGSLRVVGYDPENGKELWTVRGLARAVHLTPAIGPDNTLYLGGWTSGADPDDRKVPPTWEEMLQRDKNKNGLLEPDEFPDGFLKPRFPHFDRDKDGHVTKPEYEAYRNVITSAVNRFIAIKPGGSGDVTSSHVLWEQRKDIPFVPSPLYYNGHVFLIKNPGILITLDAKTGKQVKSERVSSGSDYYSSPVAGDGKVYLLSLRGHLTVVSGEGQWKVLHRARFDEDGYATPTLVDGRIYLRTTGHLYCFGE